MIRKKQTSKMNNTNQQLFSIYKNIQVLYQYRRLVSLDDEYTQEQFIKHIQKDKYILLSAANRSDVVGNSDELDNSKISKLKNLIHTYNEKSKSSDAVITNLLLIYPGTECENKRANMLKLINHIRYPLANVIIITPTKVSSGVAKGLQALSGRSEHRGHDFKTFTYSLLSSVLPEYELVPKYEILTQEQIDNLKKWFIDPNSLPKVFEHDPQMVWIGAKVGDVIKFTAMSEVTIESIGYCIVVPSV